MSVALNDSGFLMVSNVQASYDGENVVVDSVSFSLKEGELACLLGPSGCGKTTILRSIGGFQSLSSGSITLDGNLLCDTQIDTPPEQRNVGMVFQDHALFPHLTIAQNIAFGLNKLKASERKKRVSDLLGLIGMPDQADKYPHELSGGQSQRVALARAIAPRPKLLLMDEPFSNLDSELRESLGYEVRNLLKQLGITAVMVTHDQHDAFALGDKIGVISDGKLMQWSSSFDLYHAPKNRFVANFIGDGVFVKGKVTGEDTVTTSFGVVRGDILGAGAVGRHVDLLVRPDDVRYDKNSPIRGLISRKAFKGAQTLYTVDLDCGEQLMSLVPSHDNHDIGDTIGVCLEADHLVCFDV